MKAITPVIPGHPELAVKTYAKDQKQYIPLPRSDHVDDALPANRGGRLLNAGVELAKLNGLTLTLSDANGADPTDYDLGKIAWHALEAAKVAVLAFEQIVTGEKIIKALDVADFYSSINSALEEENGQGVMSEPGEMSSIQDEIQSLKDLVQRARKLVQHQAHE